MMFSFSDSKFLMSATVKNDILRLDLLQVLISLDFS